MKGSLLYVEGRGLANCNVIVEMYTDRPKRARQDVQYVLKKYGYLWSLVFFDTCCVFFLCRICVYTLFQ